MYRIVGGSTHNLPDVEEFLDTLNTLDSNPTVEARSLFDMHKPLIVSRAPGRLDVMGGIADYSGSLVLQWPLREAALVALQRASQRTIRIVSLRGGATSSTPSSQIAFEIPLSEFETEGKPIEYATALKRFQRDSERHWAAYAAGAVLVLMRERGVRFDEGARILISSRVPEGRGVSSSAAVEVATMQAIAAAFNILLDSQEIALLCQKVENLVVGAPCGVMDQMTAACAEDGRLLALLCQPAEVERMISLPQELALWGIDSDVSHAVAGEDYASVRVGAFMGYRMLTHIAGMSVTRADEGRIEVGDSKWNGYLARVSPSEFEEHYAAHLPNEMRGIEFLDRYQGTSDPVTRVEPSRSYRVRVPTAHPIYEHFRVRTFAELLRGSEVRAWQLLGELMYQSHASYSACGLGSTATDLLVELVRNREPSEGLYGAKITGGGSGGTVAVLGRADSGPAVRRIAEEYERRTSRKTTVFSGSSPGASPFGYLRLEQQA